MILFVLQHTPRFKTATPITDTVVKNVAVQDYDVDTFGIDDVPFT